MSSGTGQSAAAAVNTPTVDLLSARKGFQTVPVPTSYLAGGPAARPPSDLFRLIRYESPAGSLAAYLSPDPRDGQRHPAVIWAHGGFGGIGEWLWGDADPDNDQSARAFRDAGIVLMCPSWRGENDNPGRFELFYGEVDDLLAARDTLASVHYVDPERIYVAGHSTGGTLALLAAVSTGKFRAAFSFGGAPDVGRVVGDGTGYGNTPFDFQNPDECRLRSAIHFTAAIQAPTFYFEGADSAYCPDALSMEARARAAGRPFTAIIVEGGNHFDILAPLTRLVAARIIGDTQPACNISISPQEANSVYRTFRDNF